jgi:hypothetical protein
MPDAAPAARGVDKDLPRKSGRVFERNYAASRTGASYSAGLTYPKVECRRYRLYHVSM